MNTQRLLKLADLLDTVPPEQFDMGLWSNSLEFTCDTVACAAGWACSLPEFAEAGLHLQYDNEGKTDCSIHYNNNAYDPLEDFFDITRTDKEDIFLGYGYGAYESCITSHNVATLIRKKVSDYDASRV